MKEYLNQWQVELKDPIKIGIIIIALFFGFFGIWALSAPIESAAVTQGTIVVHSSNKIIQHLEGGIIKEICVKEGEQVKADQLLMILNKTQPAANLALLQNQLQTQLTTYYRLLAQQRGDEDLVISDPVLQQMDDQALSEIMATEQQLFTNYKQTIGYRTDILQQQIKQLKNEIKGLVAQRAASQEQMRLLESEINIVAKLVDAGHETEPRLFNLKRTKINLKGESGRITAAIAKAEQSISQIKLEILDFKNKTAEEIAEKLKTTNLSINDLRTKLQAAMDVLGRTEIRSPYAGIISDLKFHTIGGVIAPSSEILTIVPNNDELIIETKIDPQDIDVVHSGLKAQIRMLAFKSRSTPMLTGEVIYVSPDQLNDQVTYQPYYLGRIKVDYKQYSQSMELYPGMPAEVLIG